MRIKPAIASVVGQTNDEHWGQVFLSPHAHGVVEVEDAAGSARQQGVAVLTSLTHAFEQQPTSLKAVENIAEGIGDRGIVTLLLLVPVGRVVYLVLRGNGAVHLRRGTRVATLMDRPGAISGEVQQGDTLLLVSQGLMRTLSTDELVQSFDHLSAVEAAEKLTLLLHGKPDGYGSAGLVFQVAEFLAVEAEETKTAVPVMEQQPMETVLHKRPKITRVLGIAHTLGERVASKLTGLKRKVPLGIAGSNSRLAVVTVIVVVLFLISVVLGIRKQLVGTKSQTVSKALVEAQHAFDEGVALLELNPIKGRERLTQAKAALDPLLASVSGGSAQGKDVEKLYQLITDNLTQAMQVVNEDPVVFYDVSLLKKGAQVHAISLYGDTLGIVDRDTRTVYALGLESKSGQVVAGGDAFGTMSFVASHGDVLFVLTDAGIHSVNIVDKKTKQSVIKADKQWGTIGAMTAFGGNLYLLDVAKGRIWKYVATDTGFSPVREYLNPDTLPDLSRATGMSIDGSVWVGTAGGKILRFTQGKENTFVPKGIEPALGENLMVYTSDAVKNVYVLDGANRRVVVLDKDGTYLAQYVWEVFQDEQKLDNPLIGGFVVSEARKSVLFLANGKVFSISLK